MTYDSNVCDIDSDFEQLFETKINISSTYLCIANVYTQFNINNYTLILIEKIVCCFNNICYALCHMAKHGVCV